MEYLSFWYSRASFRYMTRSILLGLQVPLSSHPRQHVLALESLILDMLVAVMWNLKVILIFISLMTKDVKHFLKYSLPFDITLLRILFSFVSNFYNNFIYILAIGRRQEGQKNHWKYAASGFRMYRDPLENTIEEVRDSRDPLAVTLAKMPNTGKRELQESTSSR